MVTTAPVVPPDVEPGRCTVTVWRRTFTIGSRCFAIGTFARAGSGPVMPVRSAATATMSERTSPPATNIAERLSMSAPSAIDVSDVGPAASKVEGSDANFVIRDGKGCPKREERSSCVDLSVTIQR